MLSGFKGGKKEEKGVSRKNHENHEDIMVV